MKRQLDMRSSLRATAIGLCFIGVMLTSCSSVNSFPKDAREITVAVLHESQPELVLFIDVRTPGEYARDRIGESPLIPIQDIEAGSGIADVKAAIAQHASDDSNPVIVILYCERGFRSARAQKALEAEGIRSISLAGGIQAWRQETPRDLDEAALKKLNHV